MTATTPLDALLATVAAISPSDAVRTLCDDVRALGAKYGDLAGMAYAGVLLTGVQAYADYDARLRPLSLSPAGASLGERVPQLGAPCWWMRVEVGLRGSKATVRPVMGLVADGSQVPGDATHWCEPGGAGWWRIPGVEARRAA